MKSAMQLFRGNTEGALKTQDNFTKSFPVVSQVRAGVEYLSGNKTAAQETIKAGGAFIDGIPVVGHVKGVVHYAFGDKEGGDAAMISSSRATGVIGGSVGGFLAGGTRGAAAGGAAGRAVMNSVTTVVDSASHGEPRTHGTLTAVKRIREDPSNPWRYADLVVVPATVAFAGYKAGRCIAKDTLGTTPLKGMRKVAQHPNRACKSVAKVSDFEELMTRRERQLYCDIGDNGDGYEEEEDEANVEAVVRAF